MVVPALDGADRHDRGDPRTRSRGAGVGLRKNPAEAVRQHQRRHLRPRRRSRGQRGGSCHARPVPDADRSAHAADARGERPGRAERRPGRARTGAARRRDSAGAAGRRAAGPATPARAVEATADPARGARAGRKRRQDRAVDVVRARETGPHAGGTAGPGSGAARERAVRSQQGPNRVAHRRHHHPPQYSGRRNRRRRHHEQRRNRAADRRRHVGDPGRSGSRRNEYPERRARTSRRKSRSTRYPTARSRGT